MDNLAALDHKDEVKFVIASRADYEFARDFMAQNGLAARVRQVLFPPFLPTLWVPGQGSTRGRWPSGFWPIASPCVWACSSTSSSGIPLPKAFEHHQRPQREEYSNLPLCLRHVTLLSTSACRYEQASCCWRDSIAHLINWLPGCSHEDTKSVIDGNNVVKRPISGTTPNVTNCCQNSIPSSPGVVPVIWLSVASRCMPA